MRWGVNSNTGQVVILLLYDKNLKTTSLERGDGEI